MVLSEDLEVVVYYYERSEQMEFWNVFERVVAGFDLIQQYLEFFHDYKGFFLDLPFGI